MSGRGEHVPQLCDIRCRKHCDFIGGDAGRECEKRAVVVADEFNQCDEDGGNGAHGVSGLQHDRHELVAHLHFKVVQTLALHLKTGLKRRVGRVRLLEHACAFGVGL